MTTATGRTGQSPGVSGMRTLVVAMVVVDLVVLIVVAAAALTAGSDAAVAALVGGALASVVLFAGTATVNLVAGLVPSASLVVAMLTYVLQILLLAVLFLAIAQSPLGDDDTSRTWVAGGVVAATLAWIVGQVVVATRARIPVYDLPGRPLGGSRDRDEAGGEG